MYGRMSRVCLTVAVTAMLMGSSTSSAHHSQAAFDMEKCQTLTGTVRTLQFQYPHSWLWLVVPNAKGVDEIWGLEFAAPANLVNKDKRWSKNAVKKGDKVTAQFSPMRDGRNGGSMASLTLPNGDTLPIGTPACAGINGKYASVPGVSAPTTNSGNVQIQ